MTSTPFAMNSYLGKQILALVRDGDFAHAGEVEAIERCLAAIPKSANRQILDAGCGRGGTAAYMQENGWGQVTGFDVEPNSVAYASATYPQATFACGNIYDVAALLPRAFDAVTLFNVLYALPDQCAALGALAGRAKADARLVIFDYVDLGRYREAPIMDAGEPFLANPPRMSDLGSILERGGWRLQAIDDLNADYARWYAALVARIKAKRGPIESLAGEDAYAHVLGRYSSLLAAVEDGRLGGAVVYGTKLG